MRLVGRFLQNDGIRVHPGTTCGFVRIGFVKPELCPRAARASFGQQRQKRIGTIGRVGVKLKHLAMLGYDREIFRKPMRLHVEDLFQEGRLGPHVAHKDVQPQSGQGPAKIVWGYRFEIHARALCPCKQAGSPGAACQTGPGDIGCALNAAHAAPNMRQRNGPRNA